MHCSHVNFSMIQISNFGEDEIVSMFYACDLLVLCIISMLIIHPYSGKHDVGGGNHGANLAERFLRGNKNNFCSSNHQFLCNVDAKNSFAHLDH